MSACLCIGLSFHLLIRYFRPCCVIPHSKLLTALFLSSLSIVHSPTGACLANTVPIVTAYTYRKPTPLHCYFALVKPSIQIHLILLSLYIQAGHIYVKQDLHLHKTWRSSN